MDLAGRYQDDLKLFNDPLAYLRDRQSPLLREVTVLTTGRDVFGRPLEGATKVQQVVQGFGPMGELATSVGKMATRQRRSWTCGSLSARQAA